MPKAFRSAFGTLLLKDNIAKESDKGEIMLFDALPLFCIQPVSEFVFSALKTAYTNRGIHPRLVDSLVDSLTFNALTQSDWQMIKARHIDDNFLDMYKQYKSSERPLFLFQTIRQYFEIFSDNKLFTFVDIGCGENRFCEFLVSAIPIKNIRAIGTDVIDYSFNKKNRNIDFKFQKSPSVIPLDDQEANVILLANVLQHIDHYLLENVLIEIYRILAKGGYIIIFEDSWDENYAISDSDSQMIKAFHSMDDVNKVNSLILMDFIGTILLMADNINMPRPYTFRTLDNWISIFKGIGFTVYNASYMLFPKEKLHLNPQVKVVLYKEA